ncbi:MAG: hypothetical protein KA059_04920 [Elusimicrobiales bacterium]|nr:hypothetical protein [Elusimicrobiales bacterium]
MENAIKIDVRDIDKKKIALYDCIYFGTEFCENLIPVYEKKLDKVFSFGKKICILTPIITDKGLKELKSLFTNLKKYDDFEITLNDFGALMLVKELDIRCRLNIGRHLSKLFFTIKKNHIEVNNPESLKILNDIDINTFEVSNFLFSNKSISINLNNFDIKFNIYYPYVLLSTTRTCLIGLDDISLDHSVKSIICRNECIYSDYIVKTGKIKEDLIVSQNSTFIENKSTILFDKKTLLNINRTVFCVRP